MADNSGRSDALVFFGATGDLVYKKIFPALLAMARRGRLDVPVVGVARSDWTLEQFQARARESVSQHGPVDDRALATLMGRLRYMRGDYGDPQTYQTLRRELGGAARPLHYLPFRRASSQRSSRGSDGPGARPTAASSSKSRSGAISIGA